MRTIKGTYLDKVVIDPEPGDTAIVKLVNS